MSSRQRPEPPQRPRGRLWCVAHRACTEGVSVSQTITTKPNTKQNPRHAHTHSHTSSNHDDGRKHSDEQQLHLLYRCDNQEHKAIGQARILVVTQCRDLGGLIMTKQVMSRHFHSTNCPSQTLRAEDQQVADNCVGANADLSCQEGRPDHTRRVPAQSTNSNSKSRNPHEPISVCLDGSLM